MRLIIPLSLTSVEFFPVPPALTVATTGGDTVAGSTAVRRANGARLSRQPADVRGIETTTSMHLVPAPVTGEERSHILRDWMIFMIALLPLKLGSRSR